MYSLPRKTVEKSTATVTPVPDTPDVPMRDLADPAGPINVEPASVDVPTWTPMAAAVHGPRFLQLDSQDQGMIKKLHNNLGHPTAEKAVQTPVRVKCTASPGRRSRRLFVCLLCRKKAPSINHSRQSKRCQ